MSSLPSKRTKRTFYFLILAAIMFISSIYIQNYYFRSEILSLVIGKKSSSFSSSINVAVIGSAGHISSRLLHRLKQEKNWNIIDYDRIFSTEANYEISSLDLQNYQVVIYLEGISCCAAHRNRSVDMKRDNVGEIYNIAKRMSHLQLLIFAYTDTGSGLVSIDENSPDQLHLLNSYAAAMIRREDTLRDLSFSSPSTTPQMIGLRLGTVVGPGYSQRIDLLPMKLVCEAFLTGKLHMPDLESIHTFLWIEDLMRGIITLIKQSKNADRFDIFHLQSFSSNISQIVNTIALHSGAHIHSFTYSTNLNAKPSFYEDKFRTTFRFIFNGNLDQIISTLINDVPLMCRGREYRLDNSSIPCVVCGSHLMYTVLNLNSQTIRNRCRTKRGKSEKCNRFPQRLVRCPKCHHTQLSSIGNHYSYRNRTNHERKVNFKWLVDKVIEDNESRNGTVVIISCNDVGQLDQLVRYGWKIVSINSTDNLSKLVRSRDDAIYDRMSNTRLLSTQFPDIIIVQDELSRVDDPLHFLRSCLTIMGTNTKLYIQLSQCHFYKTAQFDTISYRICFIFYIAFTKKISRIGRTSCCSL